MATKAQQLPFEFQPQQQSLASRRKIAEALLAQSMQPNLPQSQGRMAARANPLQFVAQALQGYMANKRLEGIGSEEQAFGQQAGEAMKKQQAEELRRSIVETLAKETGQRATPDSVRAGLVSGDPSQFKYHEPGMVPGSLNGKPFFNITGKDGEVKPVFAPGDGTRVEVNTGAKVGQKVNEQGGTYFMYGGKGREQFDDLTKRLNTSQNILSTLDQNPSLGSGAELFQMARKWAETLGAPVSETTTPTEMAKMQLGQMVLDRLGGLGAQVSDADRKFMMETQGSLTNDPEALRRMILLEAKYTMEAVNRLQSGRDDMQQRLGGEASLPDYFFNFNAGKRGAEDLERLFKGQGFQQPVAPAAVPTNVPPGRIKPIAK